MENLLYEELKKKLRVCKLTSSNSEINIRCPFCKDSIKNPLKGHLYIQNQPPYNYYCQRCQSSGRVNNKFLDILNCDDYTLSKYIESRYKEYRKKVNIKYGNTISFLNKNINIKFHDPESPLDFEKKKYIEDRLGINISNADVRTYRIVFSLNKFLRDNGLLKVLENKKDYFKYTVNNIEKYCVGFLSADKSTIIFRSLDKDKTGYRYTNFVIFPELESKKTYVLSNKLDTSSRVVNVNIAEGIFDIIGVYNHVYNKQMNSNDIFIANCGKSFIVTSEYIKRLAVLNADINIYSDNDVDVSFFKSMIKLEPFFELNGVTINYNNITKDFGVHKSDIKIRKVEL